MEIKSTYGYALLEHTSTEGKGRYFTIDLFENKEQAKCYINFVMVMEHEEGRSGPFYVSIAEYGECYETEEEASTVYNPSGTYKIKEEHKPC